MRLPLEGLRVVSLEQFGAGPWATLQLADLGAEVIKIEDPTVGGDVGRYVPPFQEGESSLFFETFNRNKQSLSLDLRKPEGRNVLEDLVRESDAVFSNLRGDQPAKLRLRYADLRDANPRIVCVSLSGFGTTGPRAREGGYDYTVQALAGWMSVTGGPAEPPTKSGLSLVDFSAGYLAALAMLAAVWRARDTGEGCDVDLSLFETALHLLTYMSTWTASGGWQSRRMADSAHQTMVPFQAFPATDGWLLVACPKQGLWVKLCEALELPELVADERFVDFAARDRNRDELIPILKERFAGRSVAEWVELLTPEGVPCARVNDIGEALAEPQAVERGAVVSHDHPVLGEVRDVASPFALSGLGAVEPARSPFRGEHTDDVLVRICGYSTEHLRELAAAGVFG